MSVYRTHEAVKLSVAEDRNHNKSSRIYENQNSENCGICGYKSGGEPTKAAERTDIQRIERIMNALSEHARAERRGDEHGQHADNNHETAEYQQ